MNDTTTRRRLLQTAPLAALAASLLGAAGTPTDAVAAEAAPERVTVVNTDDLAEESRRLLADYRAANAEEQRQYNALVGQLSPDQQQLLRNYSDQQVTCHYADELLRLAELARHFPAFASAFRLVAEHIALAPHENVGVCCTTGAGFEP